MGDDDDVAALCDLRQHRHDQSPQAVTARGGLIRDRGVARETRGTGGTGLREPVEQPGEYGLAPLDVRNQRRVHARLARSLEHDLLVHELKSELASDGGPDLLATRAVGHRDADDAAGHGADATR